MMSLKQILNEVRSPSKRLFAKNLAILSIGELVSRLVSAIAFIHLARVLNPEGYGAVELTLAVLMFLTLGVDLGFGVLGAREVAREQEPVETIVYGILSTQIILSFVFVGCSCIAILLLPLEKTLAYLLVGYTLTLLGYPFILRWVFQGREQMNWVAIPTMVRQTLFAIIAIGVVRRPEQVLLLPVAELAGVFAAAVLSLVAFRRFGDRLRIDLRAGWSPDLIRKALPIGGSQIIWAVRMYMPTIIIGVILGQTAVGLYGAPHRIVMTFQALLVVYFTNLLPTLSKAAATSAKKLATLLRQSLLLTIPLLSFLALATTFAAPLLIRLIFGEDYNNPEAITVLWLLVWLVPINTWRRTGHNALVVMDLQNVDLIISLVSAVLLLGIVIPMTTMMGVIGTALAIDITELISAATAWVFVQRNVRRPGFAKVE